MSMVLKSIVKSYDGKKNVLDNLSIDFADTGIYGIVGRSGAGKSTLINILSGLDDMTSGEMNLDGQDMASDSAKLRDMISVIYQEFHLLPELNVYENIEIAVRLSGGDNDKESILSLMEKLGIKELSDRTVTALSGGEKQRVAIARAYLSGKKVIIADEPTGNLDYENGKFVFEMLSEISREKLVIVVSHDLELVSEHITEVYELISGSLNKIESESPQSETATSKVEADLSVGTPKRMNFMCYLKLAWGFLAKKKFALICMVLVSAISLSVFTMSLALVSFNPVDQLISHYNSSGLKIANARVNYDGIDRSVLEKYEDDVAKSRRFDIYELPEVTDIGLDIKAGAMPEDYDEYIISSFAADEMLKAGEMIDGVATYEQEEHVMKQLPEGATYDDIIGQESYYRDLRVKIVGIFDSHGSEDMAYFKFHGYGLFDYEEDNYNGYDIIGSIGVDLNNSFTLQFGGDKDNLGYKLGGEVDAESLVDIEGMTPSRLPIGVDEIILECPVLADGRKIYTYEIGDKITIKGDESGQLTKTLVGYYNEGGDWANYGMKDHHNGYYNGFEKVPEGPTMVVLWMDLGASLSPAGVIHHIKELGSPCPKIVFNTEQSKQMYSDLYYAGANMAIGIDGRIDEGSIYEMALPASIALGIASALLLLVCIVCSIILLKGNFKSMAILSGLGAGMRDTSIITVLMIAILSAVILAIGLPLAVILNVIMSLWYNLGMAIGAIEVFASISVLLGAYLIAIGANAVVLKKKKVVNSLRVE